MTRNCYDTGDWNMTECSGNCCGSSSATCVPTNEGGYCVNDGEFYQYKGQGNGGRERLAMSKNAANRETPYSREPRRSRDFPTTNRYNKGRYRDMKRKVLHDMRNEQMNVGITEQGSEDKGSVGYQSVFKVAEWVPYVLGILNVLVFAFIVYILLQYVGKIN